MAQTAEPVSADSQASIAATVALLAGKFVCPFCGSVSEKPDEPCRRCSMENTPLTRQATRARIGPWHVMQARNPSAPGMKYATLLTLIRKQQVTPRSIVRGPTTHQLWRFAAQTKGISRHFGVCYSCGGEIQPTTTICPRCTRSQELPMNPDSLLEESQSPGGSKTPRTGPVALKPVVTEVPVKAEVPPKAAPPIVIEVPAKTEPAVRAPAKPASRPSNIPVPAPAENDAESPDKPWPAERILSARDLANAFSLHYDPQTDSAAALGGSPERSKGSKTLIAVVVLMIIGALTLGYVFHWYAPVIAWVQGAAAAPASMPTPSGTPTQDPTVNQTQDASAAPAKPSAPPRAPWMMNDPVVAAPVNTAPATKPSTPIDQSTGSNTVASDQTPSTPAASPAPTPDTSNVIEVPAHSTASNQDQDTLAMNLRSNGLDCEAQGKFAEALGFYEQIAKLPKDHWPGDLQTRMDQARKNLVAEKAGR